MDKNTKRPLLCLTLTGKTLQEDAALVQKYAPHIDVAELRVDYLTEDEQLYARRFPSMINVPCILTIRRGIDGGKFDSTEFARTALFSRAMAFADQNPEKNFAYVDFEDYFHVPSLQDAALAFGVKIIRSCHDFEHSIPDLRKKLESIRHTVFEIPKIAFMPKTLGEVTQLFKQAAEIKGFDRILCAMGPLGIPSRILSHKLDSYMAYTSPPEYAANTAAIGHIDPLTLDELYNFHHLNADTNICAVTGYPLKVTLSPLLHNNGYRKHGMNRVFIPLPSTSFAESLDFAEAAGLDGMAVTVPYKADALDCVVEIDREAGEIGASNTVLRIEDGTWIGLNTDAYGFQRALMEFLGVKKLRRRRVAIIGAGGAAHAVAYVIKQMGGRACVFNRTLPRARILAERFGFSYTELSEENRETLERYADIIIQTTNVGMHSDGTSSKETNPLWFYQFQGTEWLFDIIYDPEETPIMAAARKAGCPVTNGLAMLKYQAYRQFKYFTGVDYESAESE